MYKNGKCSCDRKLNSMMNPDEPGICICKSGYTQIGEVCINAENTLILQEMNIFQTLVWDFFSVSSGFSEIEMSQFLDVLQTFDFSSVTVDNFDILFSGLPFPSSVSKRVRSVIQENVGFKTLTTVVNAFTVISNEDASFDISVIDKDGFYANLTAKNIWNTEEFSLSALSEVTMMISSDADIVKKAVNQIVVEEGLIDISVSIQEIESNLNIYAKSIFEFIFNSEMTISEAEKFEILMFLSEYDFSTVTAENFGEIFAAMSFSSNIELQVSFRKIFRCSVFQRSFKNFSGKFGRSLRV